MAVTYDNSARATTANQASTTTSSFTVGSGSDRAIFVICLVDAGTISSVSAAGLSTGGATLALAGTIVNSSGRIAAIYRGVNPSSGSQTAAVTWTNTDSTRQAVCAVTFAGVDQTTPSADYTTDATGATGGSAPSVTVPNVTADDFVIDACFHLSITAPGANQTERAGPSVGTIGFGGASTQDGADGGAMTWTTGESLIYAFAGCRVVAASGGGGGSVVPMAMHLRRQMGMS